MTIQDKFLPFVERALDWTAKRQQALSANIANIDTPNYRAVDYDFAQELAGVTAAEEAVKKSPRKFEVQSKVVKSNGNTVDLDRELTEAVKNGMQYLALLQFVNQKVKTLRASIVDGGRA